MTNIKTILAKGKLTGEEVGRIFLRDYARFLRAMQSGQSPPKDKFTNAEKQAMVNGITEPYELKQYNTFIGILQFLQKTAILYSEQYRQLKYLLIGLLHQIELAKHIETVKLLLADAPLILTETQYQRLKKEDLEAKLAKKTSVAGIILTATDYYIKNYLLQPQGLAKGKTEEESKEIVEKEVYAIVKELRIGKNLTKEQIDNLQTQQKYGLLFKAYEDNPLTNPEFKRVYWQEGDNGHYETPDGKRGDRLSKEEWGKELYKWHAKEAETGEDYIKWVDDGREAPPETTKWDILEYLSGFFNIGEETTSKDRETFKGDYPDIYEAILAEIKGIRGLELPKDYTDPVISYKTLYELDLPYYREFFRFNPTDGEAFIASFISIIPKEELSNWSKWEKKKYLDKDGNYKYQLSDFEQKELTERLPQTINRTKQHLNQIYAIQEVYRILGEELGERSITDLATDNYYLYEDTDTDELAKKQRERGIPPRGFLFEFVEMINDNLRDFKHSLRKNSPVISQATIKEIHEAVKALPIIKIKDLKPNKETIIKVRELTKDLNYYGQKGLSLFDILAGTV